MRCQSSLPGHGAHRVLVQSPKREHRAIELPLIERMQEIALILGGVHALEQPHSVDGAPESGVVAGRDAFGAEAVRMIDERGELHLPVARRRPGSESARSRCRG